MENFTPISALIGGVLQKKNVSSRILFSAHGLPRKIVDSGDPYQWQAEQTAAAVIQAIGGYQDWTICYQRITSN